MTTSILQGYGPDDPDANCYFCHSMRQLERHHVYPGNPNRKISEREGCWVWLCHDCHQRKVHGRLKGEFEGFGEVEYMWLLQYNCQVQWMHDHGEDADGFRKVFGRSYL